MSVLAGRQALMDLVATGKVVHAGTLNGNPIVLAAARSTIERLSRDNASVYIDLQRNGATLRQGIESGSGRSAIRSSRQGTEQIFHVSLMTQPAHRYVIYSPRIRNPTVTLSWRCWMKGFWLCLMDAGTSQLPTMRKLSNKPWLQSTELCCRDWPVVSIAQLVRENPYCLLRA